MNKLIKALGYLGTSILVVLVSYVLGTILMSPISMLIILILSLTSSSLMFYITSHFYVVFLVSGIPMAAILIIVALFDFIKAYREK